MNNINNYKLDDFVQDLDFRRWVLGQKSEIDWNRWLKENPDKTEMIDAARSLVEVTCISDTNVSGELVDEDVRLIMSSISERSSFNWSRALTIAASLILVIVLPLMFVWRNVNSGKDMAGNVNPNGVVMENNSQASLTLMLADSSKVILKKGSKLTVAKDFGIHSRTVKLFGEAFFEVRKNSKNPFLVYAGGVVTKVLGTEFVVRAYPEEENTVVSVQTGHVSVSKNDQYESAKAGGQIFLLPNQKGVFNRKDSRLVKGIVDNPVIISGDVNEKRFLFSETPIPKVFSKLEQAYGIKIVYDSDLLKNCNLTAVFEDENLFDIIDIICETIKASSEVAEGQIIVYAKGCK